MEVTNFFVQNSSLRFKMIDDSERYHKTKVLKSKDEDNLKIAMFRLESEVEQNPIKNKNNSSQTLE